MQGTSVKSGGWARAAALALLLAAGVPAATPALAQSSIKVIVDDTAITTMDIRSRARLLQVANRMGAGAAGAGAPPPCIPGSPNGFSAGAEAPGAWGNIPGSAAGTPPAGAAAGAGMSPG